MTRQERLIIACFTIFLIGAGRLMTGDSPPMWSCGQWYWDIYYACPNQAGEPKSIGDCYFYETWESLEMCLADMNYANKVAEPQNMSWEYGMPDWEWEKFYK